MTVDTTVQNVSDPNLRVAMKWTPTGKKKRPKEIQSRERNDRKRPASESMLMI